MRWRHYDDRTALGCLREIKRILGEVEERRITSEEGWNRVSLVYLKSANNILSECEPVV